MKVALGSDHAGFHLKEVIKEYLTSKQVEIIDYGVHSSDPADYPDIAEAVGSAVSNGLASYGILICGTGIGMCIAANKVPGVRAALCHDVFSAKTTRLHNNSNVLTMGAWVVGSGLACEVVETWLTTEFEGGRHARRVAKIEALERKYLGKVRCDSGAKA